MGSALTAAFVPSLSLFIISAQLGLAFAGVYGFARYIVAFIEIPYRSLGAISSPHVSQTLKEGNFVETNWFIKKVSLHQFLIGTAVFFAIWINIDLIFQIIPNGENFAPGKWVVFFLGMNAILTTSLSIGGVTLSFSKYYYYSLFLTLILTTSAVLLNLLCIPKWGINGAAIATLFSTGIYYLLLLSLVYWKLKVIPLCLKHTNILAIILGLFFINWLWKEYVLHIILCNPTFWISCVEAVLRSVILGGIGFLFVYYGNISEEVNALVRKVYAKILEVKKLRS
jgi:O-antigen/teichoic acid export membrane protein